MTREPDEAQEVASVARGDRAAFARLMTVHAPAIEAYATRVSGSSFVAQDIVQEVMLRFWWKAGTFDASKARLTTWLHRIAHNLCIDHLRLSSRFVDRTDDGVEAQDCEIVGDVSMSDHAFSQGQVVAKLLLELPERQRNALVLTYYQDLSNREVAEIMGLGTRAVESLLVRARASLRQHMGRQAHPDVGLGEEWVRRETGRGLEQQRAP